MRNLFKKLTLALAGLFVVATASVTVKSVSAEEYVYPTINETTPFDGVRITGINQRVQNILGTDSNTGKHLWSVDGKPSGMVNLDLTVEKSDWSNATAMRFRLKSNQSPEANTSAQDNNIAFGFGVKSATSDKIVLKMIKPYSNVQFVKPNDQSQGQLYFINSQIPYFSMGRLMNTYIKAGLNESTFGNVTTYVQSTPNGDTWYNLYSENLQNNIFDYVGEYDLSDETIYTGATNKDGQKLVKDSAVDMSQVKFVFIRFEPQNYANMCVDIGNVEILVNGVWETAVDMSKATIAEKSESKTWYETVTTMTANQCILDPTYESGATTQALKMELVKKTACKVHNDNNLDGLCDLCFENTPHYNYDLFGDGVCDDCGKSICGDGVCVDENGDGGCDVCYHRDYVAQPEPPVDDEPETPIGPIDPPAGENGGQKDDGGCSGVIGIAPWAVLLVGGVAISKKRKR